jgi:hypothetical protein
MGSDCTFERRSKEVMPRRTTTCYQLPFSQKHRQAIAHLARCWAIAFPKQSFSNRGVMNYQQIQPTDDSNRPWSIVRILPNARHYSVARFFNRRDAEDHRRVLHRFMPASEFEIVFDSPMSQQLTS